MTTRPQIFISYSHKDEREKDHLVTHLRVLQKASGLVAEVWNDERIGGGQEWKKEIERAMEEAAVAVLLVSANFLDSDFILDVEVRRLLERRERDGMVIYPILAKSCYWQLVEWLAKLQIRPQGAKPVWRQGSVYADDELETITHEIADIIRAKQTRENMLIDARTAVSQSRWEDAWGILDPLRREAPQYKSADVEVLWNETQEALQRERAEQERIAKEKAEAERQARERAQREQQERLAAQAERERAEQERQARTQAELTLMLAPNVTLEFVRVPAGEFLMGSDKTKDKDATDDELKQHPVKLDTYLIGKYPVTVAQFAAFVNAKKHKTRAETDGSSYTWTGSKWEEVKGADWRHPRGPKSDVSQKANHPVTHISWDDARAFCEWASAVTKREIVLPSEAQWEKAARGTDGRIYPWGNEPPTDKHCNFNVKVKDTTPVDRYPAGASPYGVMDMAGNVWEWTSSVFKPYPYRADDGREDLYANGGRVLRGGSWDLTQYGVRGAARNWLSPAFRSSYFGFRLAESSLAVGSAS